MDGQIGGGQVPRWFMRIFLQVRDLEERLVEKEHELTQMKRNLDESEGAIAQVTHCVRASPTFSPSAIFPLCRPTQVRRPCCRCLKANSVCGRKRWRS